ncbi:MAG: TonB-dependent receptor [Bacteroidota bacterium]
MGKIIYTILLVILLPQLFFSQTKITGKITDSSSNPLPGANIYIKGSYDGVTSKEDGSYSFKTSEKGEAIIVASYVGYKTFEKNITLSKGELKLDIVLEEQVTEMNAVVISAGSFEASDEKKGVILRPLDVVTTGSDADLYSALETLPGTQMIGETEGLFVRGGSGAETVTIVDEMVVQKPFFSSVPDIPARGRFSPMLFKGTVFSTGGYSAQYGQALSSALILKSQDLATQTLSSISLMIFGLGGSHTQRWENTSLAFEGAYYNIAPYNKVFKQRTEWDKSPVGIETTLNLRHKLTKTGMLKSFFSYNYSDFSLYMPNLDNLVSKDHIKMRTDNYYLNISYRDVLGEDWSIFGGVSYSNDKDWITPNADNAESKEQLAQGKFTLTKRIIGSSFLTVGSEYQHTVYDDLYNELKSKLTENYVAGFAEADIFFTNDLAARIGLRTEYSRLLDKTNFAPRISVAYRLGSYDQLNFAYGKFYQTPEKDFLIYTQNFDYENADHYIANYQYIGEGKTFRVEVYYKNYDNLVKGTVYTYPYFDLPVVPFSNDGNGYAKGIDVFWRDSRTISNGDYWISYSYLDTKRNFRNYPSMAFPTFATPHTFSIVFKRWFEEITAIIGVTYSHATGRPYFNPNNPEFLGDRSRSFNNLSFNISYVTNVFDNFTVIFFSIDNIPGFNNIYGYRYSSDGKVSSPVLSPAMRSVFLGMFISLSKTNPYQ